jgi:MFS family permease
VSPPPTGRPTLRENLRGLPREVWVLYAGAFVNRLGTFVLPFITLYLRHRGYSVPQAGLGLASYGLGAIAAQGAGGLLADRLGRRNTIAMSMTGGALLTISLVWVTGLWAIVGVVLLLLGFVAEIYRPASSALVADLAAPEARVAAFSAYRMGLNIGWACGLALGGIMADHSYNLLFIGDAITSLGFAAIAVTALPHGTRTSKLEERTRGHARAGSSIAADMGFLLFLGAVFLTAAVYMQNASTFALHVTGHLRFSTKTYGLLQAMNGLLVVLFELPISAWAQHRNRPHMAALGAAAFVADRAPAHARGRYQGALGMMYASAAVVGPLMGTAVYHVNPNTLWLGCGAAGVVAAALALETGRKPIPHHAQVVDAA